MEKELDGLHEVYKLIAQLTSMEDCYTLFQHLKGLTINFPTKLLDPIYVKKYVKNEVEKQKPITKQMIQKWALSFDYSERQIRRLLKEARIESEQEKKQASQNLQGLLNEELMEEKKNGRNN